MFFGDFFFPFILDNFVLGSLTWPNIRRSILKLWTFSDWAQNRGGRSFCDWTLFNSVHDWLKTGVICVKLFIVTFCFRLNDLEHWLRQPYVCMNSNVEWLESNWSSMCKQCVHFLNLRWSCLVDFGFCICVIPTYWAFYSAIWENSQQIYNLWVSPINGIEINWGSLVVILQKHCSCFLRTPKV